jgi:hypothetical protein
MQSFQMPVSEEMGEDGTPGFFSGFALWTGLGLAVSCTILVAREAALYCRKYGPDLQLLPAPVYWAEDFPHDEYSKYKAGDVISKERINEQYARVFKYRNELIKRKSFAKAVETTFFYAYKSYTLEDFYSQVISTHLKVAALVEESFVTKETAKLSVTEEELYMRVHVTLYLQARLKEQKSLLAMIEKKVKKHFPSFIDQIRFYQKILSKYPKTPKILAHKKDCDYLRAEIDKINEKLLSEARQKSENEFIESSITKVECRLDMNQAVEIRFTEFLLEGIATPCRNIQSLSSISLPQALASNSITPDVMASPKMSATQVVAAKKESKPSERKIKFTKDQRNSFHFKREVKVTPEVHLEIPAVSLDSITIDSFSENKDSSSSHVASSPVHKRRVKSGVSSSTAQIAAAVNLEDITTHSSVVNMLSEEKRASLLASNAEIKERPVVVSANFQHHQLHQSQEPFAMRQYTELLQGLVPEEKQKMLHQYITQLGVKLRGSAAFFALHHFIHQGKNPLTFLLKDLDLMAPRDASHANSRAVKDNFAYVDSAPNFLHLRTKPFQKENHLISCELTLTDDKSENSIPFSLCCVGKSEQHKLQFQYFDGTILPPKLVKNIQDLIFPINEPRNIKEKHFAMRALKWTQRLEIQGPYTPGPDNARVLSREFLRRFFHKIGESSFKRLCNDMARFIDTQVDNLQELNEEQRLMLRPKMEGIMAAYFDVLVGVANTPSDALELANQVVTKLFSADNALVRLPKDDKESPVTPSMSEVPPKAVWLLKNIFSLSPALGELGAGVGKRLKAEQEAKKKALRASASSSSTSASTTYAPSNSRLSFSRST